MRPRLGTALLSLEPALPSGDFPLSFGQMSQERRRLPPLPSDSQTFELSVPQFHPDNRLSTGIPPHSEEATSKEQSRDLPGPGASLRQFGLAGYSRELRRRSSALSVSLLFLFWYAGDGAVLLHHRQQELMKQRGQPSSDNGHRQLRLL